MIGDFILFCYECNAAGIQKPAYVLVNGTSMCQPHAGAHAAQAAAQTPTPTPPVISRWPPGSRPARRRDAA
jgi:hypothetical protein